MDVASYEADKNCKLREKMVQTVTWLSGYPSPFSCVCCSQ